MVHHELGHGAMGKNENWLDTLLIDFIKPPKQLGRYSFSTFGYGREIPNLHRDGDYWYQFLVKIPHVPRARASFDWYGLG